MPMSMEECRKMLEASKKLVENQNTKTPICRSDPPKPRIKRRDPPPPKTEKMTFSGSDHEIVQKLREIRESANEHKYEKVGEVGENSSKKFQCRCVEVIFDEHIDGDEILKYYRENLRQGLYKAFVKWHMGSKDPEEEAENGNHTHVGLILRDKPKYQFSALKDIFSVEIDGEITKPKLVNPMGKGNSSPLKKLNTYVSYLTDGHDNGNYENTWNYKYDHELDSCKPDGKVLLLYTRGHTVKEIGKLGDWNFRAYVMKNFDNLNKMIGTWVNLYENQQTFHKLEEFIPEVVEKVLKDWDPKKESLVLHGPSNMGKTELAKAILLEKTGKKALFMRNINKLRFQQPKQPLIFDDMCFRQMRREKVIHLTDIENDSDIRILFGMHTIPAQTMQIFSTNRPREDFMPPPELAIDRRLRWVDCSQFPKLYESVEK